MPELKHCDNNCMIHNSVSDFSPSELTILVKMTRNSGIPNFLSFVLILKNTYQTITDYTNSLYIINTHFLYIQESIIYMKMENFVYI